MNVTFKSNVDIGILIFVILSLLAGSVNVSTANSSFLVMQAQQQYVEPLHVALGK